MENNKEMAEIVQIVKEQFRTNLTNNKELSLLIDQYLIPHVLDKKNNAEISTPFQLRQQMLDKIPAQFWTTPKKVFEPCSGKGGFVVDIFFRFMTGLQHSIPDEHLRHKTIVEECLYFCDINPLNIFICKLLLDPHNVYNLNFHEGDTLKLDMKAKWNIAGFDAVIGNPPYSTDPSKQNTTPLYNLFTEALIDRTVILLFVTPSRWFIGGKGLDSFRNMMMNRKDIKLIVHEDCGKKWFGNHVEIKGGVSYFIKDTNHQGNCIFNGVSYDLSKYDIVTKPQHHAIIDKIVSYDSLSELYISSNYFKIRTNDKKLKDDGEIKCYVSSLKSKNRFKYVDICDFKPNFWKVITSRAAFGAYSGFAYTNISCPDEIHTDSYISFRVNDENEAKSLQSYMNCKLVNYLLSVRKISQDICWKTCKWIPLVPLTKNWSDHDIYQYFKLSADDIAIVENSI